jgi:hypothetical protein
MAQSSRPRRRRALIVEEAKDFAASAGLKEAMKQAGVLDTPTIYFLESID